MLLLVVSTLGICSTTLLLTDPPPSDSANIETSAPSALFSLNSKIFGTRDLASINESRISKDSVFELSCASDHQTLETLKTRFRLKGDVCSPTLSEESLKTQIRNISNGYVATVFRKGPSSFTTDFINLNEGENTIKVVFEGADGPIEKEFTVIRNSPKTAKK